MIRLCREPASESVSQSRGPRRRCRCEAGAPRLLDRSFGHSGVATPASGCAPQRLGIALGGRGAPTLIVTAGGPFIVDRRRPAGGPDRAFGAGGTVQLHFPGSYSDVAERIAVQRRRQGGRRRPGGGPLPAALPLQGRPGRLTRRGRLDRSFGRGGFAVTPLGGHAVGVAISHDACLRRRRESPRRPGARPLRRDGSLDRDFGRAGVASIPPESPAPGWRTSPFSGMAGRSC